MAESSHTAVSFGSHTTTTRREPRRPAPLPRRPADPQLARVLRASRIFKRMEANISISYSAIGLIQFSVILLVVGHWMACVWLMEVGRTIGVVVKKTR